MSFRRQLHRGHAETGDRFQAPRPIGDDLLAARTQGPARLALEGAERAAVVRRARPNAAQRLYARQGVRHYWLVDPEARTLEALELRDGQWVDAGTYDDEATARVPPFEAVELPIGRLFLPRASEGPAAGAGAAEERHE